MLAKIYRPAPNAMQSGKAKSEEWLLEFESETPRTVDPLMGWISNADTNSQVRMSFETREEAIEFARRQGIPFQVTEPRTARRVVKAYADNFSAYRRKPWTH
jgi:ETC complex I subunit conserved region